MKTRDKYVKNDCGVYVPHRLAAMDEKIPRDEAEAGALIRKLIETFLGIVPLHQELVPRDFLMEGRRLKVIPEHLFAYGTKRGPLSEWWIASDTRCDNGPDTWEWEGISKAVIDGKMIPLPWVIQEFQKMALGEELLAAYGGKLGFYNKIFDFACKIFFHLHQAKDEGYKFLRQFNSGFANGWAETFVGLRPDDNIRAKLIDALLKWEVEPNKIEELSQAYRLSFDSNWFVESGLLHSPGPFATMEPQEGADNFAMWANTRIGIVGGVPWQLLVKDYRKDGQPVWDMPHNGQTGEMIEWLVDQIDLEMNCAGNFPERNGCIPQEMASSDAHRETWEIWGAKKNGDVPFVLSELVVNPGAEVTITRPGVYSAFCVEGHGELGTQGVFQEIQEPGSVKFDETVGNEFLIFHERALAGVTYRNTSRNRPLVIELCNGCKAYTTDDIPSIVPRDLVFAG